MGRPIGIDFRVVLLGLCLTAMSGYMYGYVWIYISIVRWTGEVLKDTHLGSVIFIAREFRREDSLSSLSKGGYGNGGFGAWSSE